MKINTIVLGSFLIATVLMTACGAQADAAGPEADVESTQTGGVSDLESLTEALRAAGATVEPGEGITQDFFDVEGQLIKVNDAFVQVYEYGTAEAMGTDASQISEDGSTIGTSMVNWIEPPHFYRIGRMIVLYVGEEQAVLDLLEGILGPQFAGR